MPSTSWTDLPAEVLSILRRGAVLPAHPLALDAKRQFDRPGKQRSSKFGPGEGENVGPIVYPSAAAAQHAHEGARRGSALLLEPTANFAMAVRDISDNRPVRSGKRAAQQR